MSKLYFLSLGSGSSGNCYYLGTVGYGFLIDAGVSLNRVKRELQKHNLGFETIKGVFVTHEHTDHIKYIGTLSEKYKIPIYTTKPIFDGIVRNKIITQKPIACNFIEKGEVFDIEHFLVQTFEVSHDTPECVGYSFCLGEKQFTIATDLGELNKQLIQHVQNSTSLVIEANYDEKLLDSGYYPQYLKDRVRSSRGHLSNRETAKLLAENWHDELKYVFLCHLSGENNTPQLAYKTIINELTCKQITPHYLAPLHREKASELFEI